jgi:3',5'-nucleoside bisphosphate phosphatase
MKKVFIFIAILFLQYYGLSAQTRKNFRLPDIPGYTTLKGDFHMHTPFSDGTVWPTDRVLEAWRNGLDAIAITDHLEYNPNKNDVSTNLNRPYEIAKPLAEKYGIILIKAAEITRGMPPGHFNALFLEDANALKKDKVDDAFKAAQDQGAFFIWNHPGWKSQQPDTTLWFPLHTEYYNKGWMHGIEVYNEKEYYPIVHHWAREKKLTYFANSDVHGPIDFLYHADKNEHRPVTLVFVKERSVEGIREAFFNKRTLALFNDTLVGPDSLLKPFIQACLSVPDYHLPVNRNNETNLIIKNLSDFPIRLSGISTDEYVLPNLIDLEANCSEIITVKNIRSLKAGENQINLKFRVLNALMAPSYPIEIGIDLKVFYLAPPRIEQQGNNLWKIRIDDKQESYFYVYTNDGKSPAHNSNTLNKPFMAHDSVQLKIAAFSKHQRISDILRGTFFLHKGIGCRILLNQNPSKKFTGNGGATLNDGLKGSSNHNDGQWIGFEGSDLETIIELESPRDITSVEIGFFENTFFWIFLPKTVSVSISKDGKNYTEYAEKKYPQPVDGVSRGIESTIIKKKVKQVKFIKIIAKNQGICPVWHPGKGKPAWLFVDEILVR